jgi:3'-phosphoadenosine 5'-phosphosulfate sulfotransferase (PAPS reductase)/FAD synthetase
MVPGANPYLIQPPALISFSGGRTSGYMLRQILDAHGGVLPDGVHVAFANTGKERAETLDFVQRCGAEWGVRVRWLEWHRDSETGERGFVEVSHNSASRNGEPFEALIDVKGFLPNPVTRYCTQELKIRVARDFARSLGWERWTVVIGLRADEPGRVGKGRDRNAQGRERWKTVFPLYDAGVAEEDVRAFWRAQPFDLGLESYEGNCDYCFLKGAKIISRIMRDGRADPTWWIEAETEGRATKPSGARFRTDRPSYAELLDAVRRQDEFDFGIFDDHTTCDTGWCHD